MPIPTPAPRLNDDNNKGRRWIHQGKKLPFPVFNIHDSRKRTKGDYSRAILAGCAIAWLLIYFGLIYFKILR